ncbi:MAG: CHASE3 domain-containing protein [Candidatus Obscuribacter sp.]|nr:CHASE3 domain-containing protein [Candidatus Obscuribacter sp.]
MSQQGKISREMTQAKRFSPKILHKGLALVLTPIIFESVFFYQLAQLVTSAEQLAQAEARQSTIVEHTNSLISMFVNATGSIATYILTGNQTYAAMARQSRNDVNREFDELNALIGNDPRMTALTSELKSMWDEEFKKVEAITPAVTGADIAQSFTRMPENPPLY